MNSDADMMKFFIKFLRKFYKIENNKIKVTVNCYLDCGFTKEEIENYWLHILELNRSNLYTTRINKNKSDDRKTHKKLIYGTCRLSVCSVKLMQSIFGSIQEYTGINRPEWVDGN